MATQKTRGKKAARKSSGKDTGKKAASTAAGGQLPSDDDYMALLRQHWEGLTTLFLEFEERGPVMEYDIEAGQIHAYGPDYFNGLSEQTREEAKRQHQEVIAAGGMMVFVRDAEHRVLRSYVFHRDKDTKGARRGRRRRGARG